MTKRVCNCPDNDVIRNVYRTLFYGKSLQTIFRRNPLFETA